MKSINTVILISFCLIFVYVERHGLGVPLAYVSLMAFIAFLGTGNGDLINTFVYSSLILTGFAILLLLIFGKIKSFTPFWFLTGTALLNSGLAFWIFFKMADSVREQCHCTLLSPSGFVARSVYFKL